MFVIFGCIFMDGFFFLYVVDIYIIIIEIDSDYVGMFGVDIQIYYFIVSFVDVFGKRGIFQGEEENYFIVLFYEVICNVIKGC